MGDLKTSEEQADALNFIGVHLVHSHRRQTTGSPVSRASMARTLPPGPRGSEPRSPAQCHRAYPDTPQSCARLAPARPSGRKSVFFSGTGVTLCDHLGKPVRTQPFPSWPVTGQEDEQAVVDVVRSGHWYRGEPDQPSAVKRFESAYAQLTGAKHTVPLARLA